MKRATFDELVDEQTGYMIERFVRGSSWRSVVWGVMQAAIIWYKEEERIRAKEKK